MAKSAKNPDYDAMSKELEVILVELQRHDVSVDTALKHYERGLELVQALGMYLETAELKVQELKANFAAAKS